MATIIQKEIIENLEREGAEEVGGKCLEKETELGGNP